jgi:phospholipid N-methyltransferase
MEARQMEPINFYFESFEEIRKELGLVYKAEYTFERWCVFRDWVINNQEKTLAMASKLTIKQIKEIITVYHDYKKNELVEKLAEGLLEAFDIGNWDGDGLRIVQSGVIGSEFFSMSREERKAKELQQLIDRINSVTLEDYERVRATKLAKKEALNKALKNPETKEEFETFIRFRGEKALTTEQRAKWDDLVAGTKKEQRQADLERGAVVRKVDIGEHDMQIIETEHTRDKYPLWVVQLNGRVERDVYKELESRAKSLGGWYSSFRGNGAVPGFQFKDEASAKAFVGVKDGDVDTKELLWQRQEKAGERRSVVLQSKGQALIDEGEELLAVERKDNTARRARMASNAEQNAVALIELGKIMIAVGQGMEAGTVNHLEYVSNITEMDQLFTLISQAQWRMRQELKMKTDDDLPYTPAIADHVKYPYPHLYPDHVESLLIKMRDVSGKRMAAERMLKLINLVKKKNLPYLPIMPVGRRIEDFKRLFIEDKRGLDDWAWERYKKELQDFNRVYEKLKLQSLPELRAAIRELITIENGLVFLDEEQKRILQIRNLERKFVGKKIDGFFPTPKELAMEVVQLLEIEDGDLILEPSAGLGHLADAISELHPNNDLMCIEQYQPLAEALELKGYTVRNENFLNANLFWLASDEKTFIAPNKIVMNPPFENDQDVKHVYHAFEILAPRGILVAIMAGNKQQDRFAEFRRFVREHGYMTENPEGSFKSAFRPTGVATVTVVLNK